MNHFKITPQPPQNCSISPLKYKKGKIRRLFYYENSVFCINLAVMKYVIVKHIQSLSIYKSLYLLC